MKELSKEAQEYLENRWHFEEHLRKKIINGRQFTKPKHKFIAECVINDILDIIYHPAPNSIPGMLQHDRVTEVNQDGDPERLDSFKHPFLDVLKKSRHYIVDRYLYLSMRAQDFYQIVNDFDNKYFVLSKLDGVTPKSAP
jgi:hypothetical protein